MRIEKLTAKVTGTISTFVGDNETPEQAKERLTMEIFNMEREVNGNLVNRLHVTMDEPILTKESDR
jgi:hypothetical protein